MTVSHSIHPPKRPRGANVVRQRDPLRRAVQLLSALVDSLPESVGVRELAHRTGMPPSTAHRSLIQLSRENLATSFDGAGRYQLGLEFVRLAWQTTSALPVRGIALDVMSELVAASGETAVLSLYEPGRREMIHVATVESAQPLRYVVPMYKWMPLYAGASGLAILAFRPRDESRAIVRGGRLRALTSRTITSPSALERELDLIRSQGYALSKGQRTMGAVGIAAPIRRHDGEVIGSIGITMPEQRFVASASTKLSRLVVDSAKHVSARLQSRGQATSASRRAESSPRGRKGSA